MDFIRPVLQSCTNFVTGRIINGISLFTGNFNTIGLKEVKVNFPYDWKFIKVSKIYATPFSDLFLYSKFDTDIYIEIGNAFDALLELYYSIDGIKIVDKYVVVSIIYEKKGIILDKLAYFFSQTKEYRRNYLLLSPEDQKLHFDWNLIRLQRIIEEIVEITLGYSKNAIKKLLEFNP